MKTNSMSSNMALSVDIPLDVQSNLSMSEDPDCCIEICRLMLIWLILMYVAEPITTIVILMMHGTDECDVALTAMICGYLSRYFIIIPMMMYSVLHGVPNPYIALLKAITELGITIALPSVATDMLVKSKTCSSTAPELYYYTLVLTIHAWIHVVILIVPIVWILLVGCTQCVIGLCKDIQYSIELRIRMNRLPVRVYGTCDEPMLECAICIDMCKSGDILQQLPCSHEFHKTCIRRWLPINANCPLCRTSIIEHLE